MNLYWIGPREWDIKNNDMFVGSITKLGNDTDTNCSFCNNKFTDNYNKFLDVKLKEIIHLDKDALFMFANEKNAYRFGKDILEKSICVNPLYLIECMNDKIFTRNFFSDCVKMPNSILIDSEACKNYQFIKKIFNNQYSEFVLQEAQGYGGFNNYFLSLTHFPKMPKNSSYMIVTPYYNKSISINVHIVISSDTYRILPPSVQIILKKFNYSGSDFIKYSELPGHIKSKIIFSAETIAQKAISIGVRGIFGVDFLVLENEILFLECNFRYQGSSFVLNKGLVDANCSSLFEMRYNSFYGDLKAIPDNIFSTKIQLSSFRKNKTNCDISLPQPIETIAINHDDIVTEDEYIKYELFDNSIFQNFEKL